jgi:hypothetical protein
MNKFSVIIPTIWKGENLNELLINFYNSEFIEEVILINNAKDKTPNFERHEKLVYVEPSQNIFVNPSWNMGVRLAKSNNIIIANDDILFDVNHLIICLIDINNNHAKLEDLGFMGMHSDNYELEENSNTIILRTHGMKPSKGGWGCLIIFDKKHWIPIPEQLKIWYGDNFLISLGKPVVDIIGLKVKTKMSSSASADWLKGVLDNDTIEWHKLIATWRK